MLILLVAACLVWIGLLSLAFVIFSGTAVSAGWIVAGALVSAVVVWVLVMLREIRNAIKLPDFSAYGKRDESLETIEKSTVTRPGLGIADRTFTGRRGLMPNRSHKTRPRKLRSKLGNPETSAAR